MTVTLTVKNTLGDANVHPRGMKIFQGIFSVHCMKNNIFVETLNVNIIVS